MDSPYSTGAYSAPYPPAAPHHPGPPQPRGFGSSGPPRSPYPAEPPARYRPPPAPAAPWGYGTADSLEAAPLRRQHGPGYSPPQVRGRPWGARSFVGPRGRGGEAPPVPPLMGFWGPKWLLCPQKPVPINPHNRPSLHSPHNLGGSRQWVATPMLRLTGGVWGGCGHPRGNACPPPSSSRRPPGCRSRSTRTETATSGPPRRGRSPGPRRTPGLPPLPTGRSHGTPGPRRTGPPLAPTRTLRGVAAVGLRPTRPPGTPRYGGCFVWGPDCGQTPQIPVFSPKPASVSKPSWFLRRSKGCVSDLFFVHQNLQV